MGTIDTNGYDLIRTTKFKKNFKLAKKRGYDMALFEKVVGEICSDKPLEPHYEDHVLSGKYKGISELHIKPNWLLMYLKDKKTKTLTLVDMGSHGDFFDSVRDNDSYLLGLVRLRDSLK